MNWVSWPSILIFVGSIIAISGAFWAAYQKGKTDRELVDLSQKNAKLTQQLHDVMTGGNSYPLFVYSFDLKKINDSNALSVYISINGNKPIFDASIDHLDITESIALENDKSPQELINEFLSKNLGTIKGGTFLPDRAFLVGQVKMKPEWNERIFRLETIARNGVFEQVTTLRRNEGGSWYIANRKVTKVNSDKETIEILTDENFDK